jgi:hypothetical protein
MRMTSRGAPGNKGTTTHCTDRDLVSIAASLHEERPCLRIRIHGDREYSLFLTPAEVSLAC